ncbi:GAF domain-containing protein [bacterium]|nr:GAF domain-containing protein [bacterium]
MTKQETYIAVLREIQIRVEKEGNLYAYLDNVTAVLKKRLSHFNWVGFYMVKKERLILGPFQGTPACIFLEPGKGVCGTCAADQHTILVNDVSTFPGHIACDPCTKSEIVVPCFNRDHQLKAVLDVDSDQPDAFDTTDQKYLEQIAHHIRSLWDYEKQ